jgi:hypothetical protein
MGNMVAQLVEMPFKLVAGVLSTPFGRSYMGSFASKPKRATFAEYW